MKCDMGGAGAVLGAARALLDLQPKGLEVCIISSVGLTADDSEAAADNPLLMLLSASL